jgi:hypothetical protein
MVLRSILLMILSSILINDAVAQTDSAYIVFFRENQYFGRGFSYPVTVNGEKIAKIKNGTYFVHPVAAGRHLVMAKTETVASVELSLNPGDTCYLRCGVLMGMWVGRPEIVMVDKRYASQQILAQNLTNASQGKYVEIDSKAKLGMILGFGGGFERIDVFTTTSGDAVTLSTGGGANFGANVSYAPMKNLEIAFDMGYCISTMSQNLKNADADFGRGVARVTLWGVAPLKGEFMKLRYGGGLGSYFGGKMSIDASELGDHKYEIGYKPAIGFHGGIEFVSVLDKYYFTFGLQFQGLRYKVKDIKIDGYSIPLSMTSLDRKIESPNGGGFFLTMGLGFNL